MKYYVKLSDRTIGLQILQTELGTVVRPADEDGEGRGASGVDLAPVHANVGTGEGLYSLIAGGRSYQLYVTPTEEGFRTAVWRHRFDIAVMTEREWRPQKVAPRQAAHTGLLTVQAPMPGLVKSVLVAVGDAVAEGQRLLVLEAMKMENEITASRAGRVTRIDVQAGTIVEGGKSLLSIES